MKSVLIAISGGMVLMSGMVYGQPGSPGLDQPQMNQESWIERSFDRGQLNQQDAGQLTHEKDRASRREGRTKADGVVRRKEAARVGAAKNHPSRPVVRERPNRQDARQR